MSIKNKFVTAITTAGLLAGLFGSAFVPSASAATALDQDDTYMFVDSSGDAEDGYVDYMTTGSDSDGEDSAGVDRHWNLELASWAEYGTPGSKFCGRYYAQYDECDQYDNSVGFYIETLGDNGLTEADLTATATGGKVKFTWPKSANDGSRPCWDNENDWSTTSSSVTMQSGTDYGDGYYFLCISPVSKNTLGTSTITVKAENVTIAVFTVRVLGDLHSITLSTTDGQNRVAADNAAYGDFWTIVGKDAAGQAINAVGDKFNHDIEDWTGDTLIQGVESVYNENDDEIDFFQDDDLGDYQSGRSGLESDVCLEDDAGETYGAYVQMEARGGGVIESNTFNITCTGSADDYEVVDVQHETGYADTLSGEADWAESDAADDDGGVVEGAIEIWAKLVDADGKVLGVDGSSGFDFASGEVSIDAINDIEGAGDLTGGDGLSQVLGGGYVLIGTYIPLVDAAKKYEIEVTISQSDSDLDDFVGSVFYLVTSIDSDYTLTRVRNASKTKATWTADWGLECSNSVVYFDWVNKNGTKGTLATGVSPIARRANFDGVATFTLKKRNMTIFVTAYACDDFGDDPDELGPVKARFR